MSKETRLVPPPNTLTTNDRTEMVPVVKDEMVPVTNAELPAQIIAALDFIASTIPNLRTPHPKTAKRVRGARTVSREAVMSIIAMVEASPTLQRVNTLDTERAKEVVQSMDGLRLITERLDILRARVRYTAEADWADVTSDALRTYHVATAMAKRGDPELAPHLATIQRHLGRRNAATGKKGKRGERE